jgi:hypothetical protein
MNIFDYIEAAFDPENFQSRKVIQHESTIENLRDSAHIESAGLRMRVDELEKDHAKIELVCVALLRTLVNSQLITKEDFIQLVRQIDAEDGRIDGRYGGEIIPKSESLQRSEIKIDFNSARQKPESFNT